MIRGNRRVTVRDFVDEIRTGLKAVQKIINDLGHSKVCARWVPRMLTDPPKNYLRGQKFDDDESVKAAVKA
jgi:hypothetical protein